MRYNTIKYFHNKSINIFIGRAGNVCKIFFCRSYSQIVHVTIPCHSPTCLWKFISRIGNGVHRARPERTHIHDGYAILDHVRNRKTRGQFMRCGSSVSPVPPHTTPNRSWPHTASEWRLKEGVSYIHSFIIYAYCSRGSLGYYIIWEGLVKRHEESRWRRKKKRKKWKWKEKLYRRLIRIQNPFRRRRVGGAGYSRDWCQVRARTTQRQKRWRRRQRYQRHCRSPCTRIRPRHYKTVSFEGFLTVRPLRRVNLKIFINNTPLCAWIIKTVVNKIKNYVQTHFQKPCLKSVHHYAGLGFQ